MSKSVKTNGWDLQSSPPLMSAEELVKLLGDNRVKIFDVRGTWKSPARALPEDYEADHIKGATFLDWTRYFIEQDIDVGLASIADHDGARRSFADLGINKDDLVVLYDDNSHMFAGRIWWAMKHWDFTNVRVLNGGWKYWTSQTLPTSNDAPSSKTGNFQPVLNADTVVNIDAFLAQKDGACVIDGRGPAGYAGKADDPRTGHIPGSLNIAFSELLDSETGLFLDIETLSYVFDRKAPHWRDRPIITTCGAGYAATVVLLALAQLDQSARLFDGSFGVWKQDPNRPIEQSIKA